PRPLDRLRRTTLGLGNGGEALRPRHGPNRADRGPGGRGPASIACEGLRPVRTAARQLVDHRLRLHRDARVPELSHLAALSTGMTDKETGVSNSRVSKIVVCLLAWLFAGLVTCLSPCPGIVALADFDEVIDSPMYRNPELSFPREIVKFPE